MTATPNSSLNESLSALVDGEQNDLDLQRVLKSMDENDDAREMWTRYQQISSMMKSERVDLSIDLSASIREAIAEESNVEVKHGYAGFQNLWSGLGKTAVAATVTVGVVFGVQQFTYAPVDDANIAEASNTNSSSGAVVPQGFELPPLTARTVSTDTFTNKSNLPRSAVKTLPKNSVVISSDEFQEQINRLMFKHAEQVSSSGGMGVIPFARVSELNEGEED